MSDQKSLEQIIKETIGKTFLDKFPKKVLSQETKLKLTEKVLTKGKILLESLIVSPKKWILKTEYLTEKAKEAHFKLYEAEVEAYNKVSSQLDAVNKDSANSNSSAFRFLKMDESDNKNA